MSATNARVTVYTKPACVQCDHTKRYLDKLGVPFDELPMTDEVIDQAKAAGIMTAPIVLVEGKAVWGGFKPDEIKKLAA